MTRIVKTFVRRSMSITSRETTQETSKDRQNEQPKYYITAQPLLICQDGCLRRVRYLYRELSAASTILQKRPRIPFSHLAIESTSDFRHVSTKLQHCLTCRTRHILTARLNYLSNTFLSVCAWYRGQRRVSIPLPPLHTASTCIPRCSDESIT